MTSVEQFYLTADRFAIRRFCEDEFAYDPRNTADGKVHLRKVVSTKRYKLGRFAFAVEAYSLRAKANRTDRNSAYDEVICGYIPEVKYIIP